MRFIGNKEKLTREIYNLLQKHNVLESGKQSFFDVFSGSASVGKFFKQQGFFVNSCDILYFSYCLQMAYLHNSEQPQFDNLHISESNSTLFATPYEKVIHFLNNLSGIDGFIYQNYAPTGSKKHGIERMYFSDENAKKIDSIRLQIEQWKNECKITQNEYFILLATLIESVSFFANVTGVYAAFCKEWDARALKSFELKPIKFINGEIGQCFCDNSLNVLNNTKDKIFDILYLDPPYNQRQYAPNYHLIETIAKYDNPKIQGIAGLRDWKNQKSNFCNAKNALIELEKIALIANYKYLVLSYNSEGLLSKEEICEILQPIGNMIVEKIPYPRYKSNNKTDKTMIFEYIWILEC